MPKAVGMSSAMHVVTTRQRRGEKEYTATLLRRSYREGGKVKKQTLANLSHLPDGLVELIRRYLRGERFVASGELCIERSLPAGHVCAVLAMARRLELGRLLDRSPSRERDVALALICQRVLEPGSKLATARLLGQSTLAGDLGVEGADEDDLYAALDWLAERQERIERRLARRHLADGDLVFYDLSSSYFEGRSCPLAALGYSRDGRRGMPQIVYGLLTDRAGKPIAVEVFDGNVHDHQTVGAQLERLKGRFGLAHVVLVADRGMVTKANLEALAASDGVEWVTALKAPQVKKLAKTGAIQPSLFDEVNLAEITSEQFPGERLVVCRNPLVAAERTRKRSELLAATEAELEHVRGRVERGTLSDAGQIGLAVGEVVKRFHMKKHFDLDITDAHFSFSRKTDQIAAEQALDGIYVLRTSVTSERLDSAEIVRAYKDLQHVEQAFRVLKGPELEIRPIHHRLERRVRAHVFCCMLALYLERHLRDAWAELTYTDEHPPERPDPVAKARRSAAADHKAHTKHTTAGQPAHSFRGLLAELALQTRNTVRLPGTDATFDKLTEPTPLQARAIKLAGA
jgi:hypothetical protein